MESVYCFFCMFCLLMFVIQVNFFGSILLYVMYVCYLYVFVGVDVICMLFIEFMWCFCFVIVSLMKDGYIMLLGVCMFYIKCYFC